MFVDWGYFENFFIKFDVEYEIVFCFFDIECFGKVKYEDFCRLYELNKGLDSILFDWECDWVKFYIGSKVKYSMDYQQFL